MKDLNIKSFYKHDVPVNKKKSRRLNPEDIVLKKNSNDDDNQTKEILKNKKSKNEVSHEASKKSNKLIKSGAHSADVENKKI